MEELLKKILKELEDINSSMPSSCNDIDNIHSDLDDILDRLKSIESKIQ